MVTKANKEEQRMYIVRKLKFVDGTPVMDRIVLVTLRLNTAKKLVEMMSLEDIQPLLTGWCSPFNVTSKGFEAYYIYKPSKLRDLVKGVV